MCVYVYLCVCVCVCVCVRACFFGVCVVCVCVCVRVVVHLSCVCASVLCVRGRVGGLIGVRCVCLVYHADETRCDTCLRRSLLLHNTQYSPTSVHRSHLTIRFRFWNITTLRQQRPGCTTNPVRVWPCSMLSPLPLEVAPCPAKSCFHKFVEDSFSTFCNFSAENCKSIKKKLHNIFIPLPHKCIIVHVCFVLFLICLFVCVCECLLQNNNQETKHKNKTNCGNTFEPDASLLLRLHLCASLM